MLRALAADGLRLTLVSSDSKANARVKLGETAALFDHFDCSASIFGKPAKFRRILKRTAIDPARVIAIGDETRDIEAARATGIACAAVTWGYAAPNALKALGPDLVFERMDDIPRALIVERG
jgi:phosphoglycolate phosphatase